MRLRHFRRLCLIGALLPAAYSDQVTLKNGDTITGTIVKKDGDKLTLKSEYLGDVTMPWAAVTGVKSDASLHVVLPGGETSGKVSTAGSNLAVEAPSGERTAPLTQVSAIRNQAEQDRFEKLQHPGLLELWSGAFDLGFSIARGNAHTDTLTTAFTAVRPTTTDKTSVYFNQIYSSAKLNGVNGTTAEAVRGGLLYEHNLNKRIFFSVLNDYEYDQFQNLDLRFVLGGGPGYHLINGDRTKLDVLAGGDYERENFGNNLTRNSGEVYFGDALTYKVSGATSLTEAFRVFNNLSETGEYRFNFDLGTTTTLRKWLSWQITASDRFVSNPDFGRQRNDLLLTTGVRVTFAR